MCIQRYIQVIKERGIIYLPVNLIKLDSLDLCAELEEKLAAAQ